MTQTPDWEKQLVDAIQCEWHLAGLPDNGNLYELFEMHIVAEVLSILTHQLEEVERRVIDIPQTQWGNAIHQVKADIDHFRHEQRQALSKLSEQLEGKE
jgi:hypothetical protein